MQSVTKMRQRQKRKRENAEQQLTSLYNQQETKRKSKSLRDNSDVKNVTASVTDENAPVKLEALSQLSADNKLLHNVIIKDEKLKTADSETTDTDSDDDDQGVSRYERLRLRNIQDNQQFLAQLGVYESKERVRQAFTTPKRLASQRGLKEPRSSKPVLTRRHSLRISRHSPEGNPLPPLPDPVAEIEEHLRPPAGPLNLVDYLYGAGADEDFLVKFTNRMKCLGTTTKTDISHDTFASVAKQMKSLRLAGVAKVVPSRSFSVAIHPTCKKIVVASGGKWGTVGIWDQSAQDDRMGFMAFSPHSRPVCCLAFSSFNPSCLFSCSYDGSLRCTHIDKGICDEIYSVPEDDGVLLRNLDFVDDSTLLVSQGDGRVALVDTRTEGANAEHTYQLHNKSLRSVSVHPLERHYFCTSSVDGRCQVAWQTWMTVEMAIFQLCLHMG